MLGQALTQGIAGVIEPLQRGEGGVEQPQEVAEGLLIAAVWGGGEQQQVPLTVFGQTAKQGVALVP